MNELALAWKALTAGWTIPAAFAGVVWGIIGGALPGHLAVDRDGAAAALHLRHGSGHARSCMLASVYVGAEYGGSIPAILIRTPGTNSAAATVIDGFEMNRQGRGGEALGISLMSGPRRRAVRPRGPGGRDRAARARRALLHAARLLRARRARPQRDRRAVGQVAAQGPDRGHARLHDRHHRHRPGLGRLALHLRLARPARRHPPDHRHGRPVRGHRADGAGDRAGLGEGRRRARRASSCPTGAMWKRHLPAAGDRRGDRHLRGRDAGRRRHDRGLPLLQRGEALVEASRGVRPRLGRGRRRARMRQQRRHRRPRSSRCSGSASPARTRRRSCSAGC